MKKIIWLILLVGLCLGLRTTVQAAQEFSPSHNERTRNLYNERIAYYKANGWNEWKPTSSDLARPIGHTFIDNGQPKKLGYRVAGIDTNNPNVGRFPRLLINLVGYEGSQKIETQYQGGNGGYNSTGVWASNNGASSAASYQNTGNLTNNIKFFRKEDSLVMIAVNNTLDLNEKDKKEDRDNLLYNLKMEINNSVYETVVYPDEVNPAFRGDFYIYNTEETVQNITLFYYMDAYLRGNASVPITGLPQGKGIAFDESIESDGRPKPSNPNHQRLVFSLPRSKKIPPVQYITGGYADKFVTAFGGNVNGPGRENQVGVLGSGDQGAFFKQKPVTLQPGEKTQFSLLAGLSASNNNPEIYLDEEDLFFNEGDDINVNQLYWYDYENDSKSGAISYQVNDSSTPIFLKNYQKVPPLIEGQFSDLALNSDLFNLGKNKVVFLIKDEKDRVGRTGLNISVRSKVKFVAYDQLTGKKLTPDSFDVSSFGLLDEGYGVSENKAGVEVPSKLETETIVYTLDTAGQTQPTGATHLLTGKYTREQMEQREVKVNYIGKLKAKPSITLKQASYEMNEQDPHVTIKGTWKDETKSKGKIEIKKGDKVVGSYIYGPNTPTGNWTINLPKAELIIGENDLDVIVSHDYSDYVSPKQSLKVHRKKQVTINVKEYNEAGNHQTIADRGGIALSQDVKVGDNLMLTVPEYLSGETYLFDAKKTTGATGLTVQRPVTTSMNEIDIFYKLNEVSVTIRYHNSETKKPILASLTGKTRKDNHVLPNKVIVGTEITSLLKTTDLVAEGYVANPTVLVEKQDGTTITDGKVGDQNTIITLEFLPKFEIKAPNQLDFGGHKLSIFDKVKTLNAEASLTVVNTREGSFNQLNSWKVTGHFDGFKIGSIQSLNGYLAYEENSLEEATATQILQQNAPNNAQTKIDLKNKLKLNVFGSGSMLGEYQGTMTWTLEDVL